MATLSPVVAAPAVHVREKRIGLFSTVNSLLRLVTSTVDRAETIIVTNLDSIVKLSQVGLEEATMVQQRSQLENTAELRQLAEDLKVLAL